MKIKRTDSKFERKLLIAMILYTALLKQVAPMFDAAYLNSPMVKLVGGWVVDYYDKFGIAPVRDIEGVFEKKRSKMNEDQIYLVEDFFKDLDAESNRVAFNDVYLVHQTSEYFKKQKMLFSAKMVQELIEDDRYDQAEEIWRDSLKIPTTAHLGYDIINDKDLLQSIFDTSEDSNRLEIYTGIAELDRMIGPLNRGWLSIFMGPMKRGKTWALVNAATNAYLNGKSVVFISLEQEVEDLAKRMWMNLGSFSSGGFQLDFAKFNNKGFSDETVVERIERPLLNRANVMQYRRKLIKSGVRGSLRFKSFPMQEAGMPSVMCSWVAWRRWLPRWSGTSSASSTTMPWPITCSARPAI